MGLDSTTNVDSKPNGLPLRTLEIFQWMPAQSIEESVSKKISWCSNSILYYPLLTCIVGIGVFLHGFALGFTILRHQIALSLFLAIPEREEQNLIDSPFDVTDVAKNGNPPERDLSDGRTAHERMSDSHTHHDHTSSSSCQQRDVVECIISNETQQFGSESLSPERIQLDHITNSASSQSPSASSKLQSPSLSEPELLSSFQMISLRITKLRQSQHARILLLKAVARQDIRTTSRLLKLGVNSRLKNELGRYPIHIAAVAGNAALVEMLYADMRCTCDRGKTALEYASSNGKRDVVKYLLQDSTNSFSSDADVAVLERAIELARAAGHMLLITWLIQKQENVQCNRERTELHRKGSEFLKAVALNNAKLVQTFLEGGFTKPCALAVAIEEGASSVISVLLDSISDGHRYDIKLAISEASRLGDDTMVKRLLQQQGSEEEIQSWTTEALTVSLLYGHDELSMTLGMSPAANYWRGLETAVLYKNFRVFQWLVEHPKKKNCLDSYSINRLLELACTQETLTQYKHINRPSPVPIMRHLLDIGAKVDKPMKICENVLQRAIATGDCEVIEILISRGADANANAPREFGGRTPLMAAVDIRSLRAFQILLNSGATMQDQEGMAGNILQTASFLGLVKIVEEILNRGFNVDARLDQWGSPLMLALQGGKQDVADLLLSRGANVNIQTRKWGTALHFAAMMGMEKMTKKLVGAGADVNAEGGYYGTALQAAVARGHDMIALFLLDNGADVDLRGGHHGSALNATSARSGGATMAELLILRGATVTDTDN